MTIFPRKRLIESQEDCHVASLKAPQTLGMSSSDRPSQVGEGTRQESALTRRTSRGRSRGGVGLGLSGKQQYPATPELTAWQEKPADSSQ